MKLNSVTISIFSISLMLNVQAMTPPEHGVHWKELSHEAKYAYILGVIHARSYTLGHAATEWLPKEEQSLYSKNQSARVERVLAKTAVKFSTDQLIEGMDYLYSDPANVYVSRIDILYFARDRAQGIDITSSIQKKRKEALEYWEIMLQHLKNQNNRNK